MKMPVLALASLLLLSGGMCLNAQVQMLTNGNLETWSGSLPSNWGGTSVVSTSGLVSGSNYAGVINAGASLAPGFAASYPMQFELSFVFAATDPGSSSSRSFNLSINQNGGAQPTLNFRTVEGSSGAGYITLQAYKTGSGWSDVATNLLATSNLTVGASDSGMHAYTFDLSVDLAASTWTLVYGLVGSGSTTTVSGLNYFQSNNGSGLASLAFLGTSSATAYAVDNASLLAVPEPGVISLLTLGASLLLATRLSRRRIA